MNTKNMLQFLRDLEANNSLEWMKENKKEYLSIQEIFIELVHELILRISEFDSSIPHLRAEDLIFRLNQDTRFGKDKSPYNPTFRAHISQKGKMPIPVGYYISIAPNNRSFLGGGLFTPMFKDATTMIRNYITEHGAEFENIITSADFTKYFTVRSEALKNVPTGYDVNHPQAEYLKNKSWYLEYPVSDHAISDTDRFVRDAIKIFALMQPFNDFLNCALKGFQMPARKY